MNPLDLEPPSDLEQALWILIPSLSVKDEVGDEMVSTGQ